MSLFEGAASWFAAFEACSGPVTQGSSGSRPICLNTVACSMQYKHAVASLRERRH